ncbi:hypothetical protein KIPB_011520, partial [Kipferlia bialata]
SVSAMTALSLAGSPAPSRGTPTVKRSNGPPRGTTQRQGERVSSRGPAARGGEREDVRETKRERESPHTAREGGREREREVEVERETARQRDSRLTMGKLRNSRGEGEREGERETEGGSLLFPSPIVKMMESSRVMEREREREADRLRQSSLMRSPQPSLDGMSFVERERERERLVESALERETARVFGEESHGDSQRETPYGRALTSSDIGVRSVPRGYSTSLRRITRVGTEPCERGWDRAQVLREAKIQVKDIPISRQTRSRAASRSRQTRSRAASRSR